MSVRIVRPLLRGPRSGITAAHPLAVSAGTEVFAAGGNALDAAVAAGAALAVLTPDACGLGGDALLLVQAPGEPPVAYVGGAAVPKRPIRPVTVYRVAVVPPPSQALLAVLALEALDGAPPPGTAEGEHASIEAIKAVFELRDSITAGKDVEALRAAPIPPAAARASALRKPTASDHTAAVVSADSDGLVVSMLVSVFHEFGSGVLVPGAGFLLNNRLSGLVGWEVDLADLPHGRRPGHTLSPMLLELNGRRVALATPGADGQVQTLVQIVRLLTDTGTGLSAALHAPRWRAVEGRLVVEASFDADAVDGLAARGHLVDVRADGDPLFGGAAAAGLGAGGAVLCASDPRREVWAAVR